MCPFLSLLYVIWCQRTGVIPYLIYIVSFCKSYFTAASYFSNPYVTFKIWKKARFNYNIQKVRFVCIRSENFIIILIQQKSKTPWSVYLTREFFKLQIKNFCEIKKKEESKQIINILFLKKYGVIINPGTLIYSRKKIHKRLMLFIVFTFLLSDTDRF